MPLIYRSYSKPDEMATCWSTETSTTGKCLGTPFSHTMTARSVRGEYSGVRLANFTKRKNAGELLPFTSYVRWDSHTVTSGSRKLTWKPQWCSSAGSNSKRIATINSGHIMNRGVLLEPLTSLDATSYIGKSGLNGQYVVQKAAAKLWDGLDVGTFLAELGSVVSMIAKAATAIMAMARAKPRALLAMRRRDPGKDYADKYLEVYYGWYPLMMDIIKAIKALEGKAKVTEFRATATDGWSTHDEDLVNVGPLSNGESFVIRVTTDVTISLRAHVVGRSKFGFAKSGPFINPLLTAWELVRYSFVIDWLLSVGNAIKALSTNLRLDTVVASYGYFVVIQRNAEVISASPGTSVLSAYEHRGNLQSTLTYRCRVPTTVSVKPFLVPHGLSLPNLSVLLELLRQFLKRR